MVFQPRQRRAHHADRGVARRHRRMAGHSLRVQHQRGIALFGDADQRGRLVEALHDAFGDQQALVDHEVEADAARGEQCRDRFGAGGARGLFVMAERKIDRSLGAEAGLGHRLGRLQHGIEVALVVPGAAAPDEAVGDHAVKGRLLPVLLGARRHRHDILMREECDRLRPRVGACPCVEQAVATDDFAFGRGMKRREALFDMRAHAAQCFGVLVGLFVAGNGAEADRFGQPLGRCLCIDLGARHGRDLKLPRAMGEGVECKDGGEDDDNRDCEQQDVADDSDQRGAWSDPGGDLVPRTAASAIAVRC